MVDHDGGIQAVTQKDRELRRSTFDEAVELYDRARPGYPAALFEDLAELTSIGPESRVLEIGPGTGQATLPLAERGCRVVAVELGADLAAVARRKLAGFANVEVVTAAFEDWPLPAEAFDLVLAATAFHWIDPAVRIDKVADALRPGGSLATITTHHVAGGDESFFAYAQSCYVRWDPDTPTALTPSQRPTSPAPTMGSTEPIGSGPRCSAGTSGTGRTRPSATSSCCSPIRVIAPSNPRPRAACSAASPT